MSLYSLSGQINTTVVNGSSYTGLHASDGSYNVVINSSSSYLGLYHPCGAYNAVIVTNPTAGYYNSNGSVNIISNGTGGYYFTNPQSGSGIVTPSFTTFSAGTLSNANLTNANLTVTRTNTSTGGCQSVSYKTAGKFYFEITVGNSTANTDFVGVMDSTTGYPSETNGTSGNYWGYWVKNNQILLSGGSQGGLAAAPTAGQRLRLAVDVTNAAPKGWIALENGLWNNDAGADPAAGTNGKVAVTNSAPVVAFSAIGSPTVGDNFTANFGGSAFAFTPPTGFTQGWPA